jgi:molybdopterin converting factor small subunit
MPRVFFTQNLRRHVGCPEEDAAGSTVREVLDAYFARHPLVRGYVLDEHGALRQHVVVFVGEGRVTDRSGLGEAVAPGDEVWVMQALSGG